MNHKVCELLEAVSLSVRFIVYNDSEEPTGKFCKCNITQSASMRADMTGNFVGLHLKAHRSNTARPSRQSPQTELSK